MSNIFNQAATRKAAARKSLEVLPRRNFTKAPNGRQKKEMCPAGETLTYYIEEVDVLNLDRTSLNFDLTLSYPTDHLTADQLPFKVMTHDLSIDHCMPRLIKSLRIQFGGQEVEYLQGTELKAVLGLIQTVITDEFTVNRFRSCYINKEDNRCLGMATQNTTPINIQLHVKIPFKTLSSVFQTADDMLPLYTLANHRMTIEIELEADQLLEKTGFNPGLTWVSITVPYVKGMGVYRIANNIKTDLFNDSDLNTTALQATRLVPENISFRTLPGGGDHTEGGKGKMPFFSLTAFYLLFVDKISGRIVDPSSPIAGRTDPAYNNFVSMIKGYGFEVSGDSGSNSKALTYSTKYPADGYFDLDDSIDNFRDSTFDDCHSGKQTSVNTSLWGEATPYILSAPTYTLFGDPNDPIAKGIFLQQGTTTIKLDTDVFPVELWNSITPVLITQGDSYILFEGDNGRWLSAPETNNIMKL